MIHTISCNNVIENVDNFVNKNTLESTQYCIYKARFILEINTLFCDDRKLESINEILDRYSMGFLTKIDVYNLIEEYLNPKVHPIYIYGLTVTLIEMYK